MLGIDVDAGENSSPSVRSTEESSMIVNCSYDRDHEGNAGELSAFVTIFHEIQQQN
jgi:hypothetical protein